MLSFILEMDLGLKVIEDVVWEWERTWSESKRGRESRV